MANCFTEYSQKRRATGVIIIHREQKNIYTEITHKC